MRVVGIFLVALVVFAAFVAADSADADADKPRRKKNKKRSNKPAKMCDKGWRAVGNSLCCPKDHSQLIDGACFEECHSDSDDMQLGGWVGCRELCDGGYSSSVNTCTNGINSHERKDHTRDSVHAKAQKKITAADAKLMYACPKDTVEVLGGCCPKEQPKLIAGECYGGCEDGKEEFVLGRFVGCRANCRDGYDQHTNDCTKLHEDPVERGDFPRHGVSIIEKSLVPTPAHDDGCGQGWVRASKRYCCPTTEPNLKDLLCYANCKTGYEESGYGCRKKCKAGWKQTVLECGKGNKHYRRKGYERGPKPSKLRL